MQTILFFALKFYNFFLQFFFLFFTFFWIFKRFPNQKDFFSFVFTTASIKICSVLQVWSYMFCLHFAFNQLKDHFLVNPIVLNFQLRDGREGKLRVFITVIGVETFLITKLSLQFVCFFLVKDLVCGCKKSLFLSFSGQKNFFGSVKFFLSLKRKGYKRIGMLKLWMRGMKREAKKNGE